MMIPMLLMTMAATEPATPAEGQAPIQVWISSSRVFRPGDPVRVEIETGRSGYLLVLQYDPSGKVHVLFPVDPGDETWVQAGRRYAIRPDEQNRAFMATDGGMGLVYAAMAEDPFRFDGVMAPSGVWDPGAMTIDPDTNDPEAELTALVQRLVSPRGFDYDLLDYTVIGAPTASRVRVPSWWSPTYVAVYEDCWRCGSWVGGHYVGVGTRWGWWDPYYGYGYYSPYGYRPWSWRYGYYGYSPYDYYGYGGYYPRYYPGYYPPNYPPRTDQVRLVGRPRGYVVNPPPTVAPSDRIGGSFSSPRGERGVRPAPAPARRARPVPADRPSAGAARPSRDRPSPEARPSRGRPSPEAHRDDRSGNAGSAGSAGRPSGSGTGSDRGDRPRPRGDRPTSRMTVGPQIETARPIQPGRPEFVRIDGVPVPARTRPEAPAPMARPVAPVERAAEARPRPERPRTEPRLAERRQEAPGVERAPAARQVAPARGGDAPRSAGRPAPSRPRGRP